MDRPLMPKATAVWLVENTALTFDQIADFCGLHILEVKGIADDEVATGIRGLDPVNSGVLTREEIARCETDAATRLEMIKRKAEVKAAKKAPRYTPLSKRQDRPDAIAWLLRYHPELSEQQICKLLGTTKTTVQAVRERTHWKSTEIRPRDPVLLELCSQTDLDLAISKGRAARGDSVLAEPQAAEAHLSESPPEDTPS